MALKKSQLYSSLWKSCNELRGGMDASQYKDYVLTLLFMKYVSDKNADPESVIIVPENGGFGDMVACWGQKDIGDRFNKIIGRLAEANDLNGVIDQADFNDESKLGRGKAMQDRLSKLVAIFNNLDFSTNRAGGDDLLGDAYEYLMRKFATQAGKAKGQFYTPAEVSRVMAKVIGIGPETRQDRSIYDPTCGSGSLLLRAADEAPRGLSIYGQEMDNATWGLARMNMILHGHETAELKRGDTLADPQFRSPRGGMKAFDFAVANPPFSTRSWSNGFDPMNDEFGRFEDGIPPDQYGDYAFLLHVVKSLKSNGKGAIILPHGVLFRGKREAGIRRNLIRRGLIKAIIGLPPNLFFGTSIPACILVIDKEASGARRSILVIDASRDFTKDGPKNRLRARDVHRIVDVLRRRIEISHYSRMVPLAEISNPANKYNLNIPRYIASTEPEDLHDLDAHLNGGIPNRDLDALKDYWQVFPSLRMDLFRPDSNRPGYSDPKVTESSGMQTIVRHHQDFQLYKSRVAGCFQAWCDAQRDRLRSISTTTSPPILVRRLADDLLRCFDGFIMLDSYDTYQCLIDYWTDTMHDDVCLIVANSWLAAAQPRQLRASCRLVRRERPDLVARRKKWRADLIPPQLLIARYFTSDQASIASLRVKCQEVDRQLADLLDAHGGTHGTLRGLADDRGTIAKKSVAALEAKTPTDRHVVEECLRILSTREATHGAARRAEASLNDQVLARYGNLTESAIKELVINDKWFAYLRDTIDAQVTASTEAFVARITSLQERYASPLVSLEEEAALLQTKVRHHIDRLRLSVTSSTSMDTSTDSVNHKRTSDTT